MSLLSTKPQPQPSAAHLEGVFKQMTGRKKKKKSRIKISLVVHTNSLHIFQGGGKRVMNYLMRPKGMGIGTEADMSLHHILIIN